MNRTLLILILGTVAAGAVVAIIPSTKRAPAASAIGAYPYVPLAIVPGMTLSAYAECLSQHQVHINPICLQQGVMKAGTVEASTADHRLTVYTDFAPTGLVTSVKFRIMASPATLAQLDRIAGTRYRSSGWTTPPAHTSQATYVNSTKQVTVYHLFECDPMYDAEPYYFAMDVTESIKAD